MDETKRKIWSLITYDIAGIDVIRTSSTCSLLQKNPIVVIWKNKKKIKIIFKEGAQLAMVVFSGALTD